MDEQFRNYLQEEMSNPDIMGDSGQRDILFRVDAANRAGPSLDDQLRLQAEAGISNPELVRLYMRELRVVFKAVLITHRGEPTPWSSRPWSWYENYLSTHLNQLINGDIEPTIDTFEPSPIIPDANTISHNTNDFATAWHNPAVTSLGVNVYLSVLLRGMSRFLGRIILHAFIATRDHGK